MEAGDSTVGDRLRRYRWSLRFVSLVLAAYYLAQVKLPQKFTIYGVEFEIANPEYLVYLFWMIWIYLLLRYLQYQHLWSPEKKQEYGNYYSKALTHIVAKKIFRRYVVEEKRRLKAEPTDEFDHRFQMSNVELISCGFDWCNIKLDIAVTFKTAKGGKGAGGPKDWKTGLLWDEIIWPRRLARISVLCKTPYVTEYWLPFVVAASPVLAAAISYLDTLRSLWKG
jgi:hypothetical protein